MSICVCVFAVSYICETADKKQREERKTERKAVRRHKQNVIVSVTHQTTLRALFFFPALFAFHKKDGGGKGGKGGFKD